MTHYPECTEPNKVALAHVSSSFTKTLSILVNEIFPWRHIRTLIESAYIFSLFHHWSDAKSTTSSSPAGVWEENQMYILQKENWSSHNICLSVSSIVESVNFTFCIPCQPFPIVFSLAVATHSVQPIAMLRLTIATMIIKQKAGNFWNRVTHWLLHPNYQKFDHKEGQLLE